jgi:hypothetical protein
MNHRPGEWHQEICAFLQTGLHLWVSAGKLTYDSDMLKICAGLGKRHIGEMSAAASRK